MSQTHFQAQLYHSPTADFWISTMGVFDKHECKKSAFLPAFLPDETLYSLCARYHHLSGNRLAAKTSHQLFGVGTAAMLHDFPAHLEAFAVRTEGRLGDAVSITLNRTLLRAYAPYQPPFRIESGIQAMKGSGVDRLKFRLGLPSGRVGATHPLKACAQCMREELVELGGAYWHLHQQHPTVWICSKHGVRLMQSTGKSKTQNKLQWMLPHTLESDEWTHFPELSNNQSLLLERLNEFASGMSAAGTDYFDPKVLRQCYLLGVKQMGWLTRSGSIRLKAVRSAFLDQTAELLDIGHFSFIESVNHRDGGFLAKLLRNPRSHLHPTKHLLVQTLLFATWTEFWASFIQIDMLQRRSTEATRANSLCDSKVEVLLTLIAEGSMSLAQAARSLELPYDVARYWLKRAGVIYVRPSANNDAKT